MTTRALAVIPARLASTRFPRKLLADRTGKPLIQHVVDRVLLARRVERIIVAADHDDLVRAVTPVPGRVEAMLTRTDHPNGTSRIAEVVARLTPAAGQDLPAAPSQAAPWDLIINVQGDEPEIEPEVIDQLVDGLAADPEAPMATLASEFAPDENPANPNIVKLVTTVGPRRRALYFSRSLIPFDRDRRGPSVVRVLKHPGLYAYRPQFLLKYVTLAATPLEQAEQLEQLRALEHGHAIAVVMTTTRHHGVDTAEQYEAFVRRWQARQ